MQYQQLIFGERYTFINETICFLEKCAHDEDNNEDNINKMNRILHYGL